MWSLGAQLPLLAIASGVTGERLSLSGVASCSVSLVSDWTSGGFCSEVSVVVLSFVSVSWLWPLVIAK